MSILPKKEIGQRCFHNLQGSKPGSGEAWAIRIAIKYALLQLPALFLLILALLLVQRWIEVPAWTFWGIVSLWVAKDIIMFRYTWRAYDWNHSDGADSMIGARGVALDRLAPSGYIRIRGELWRAEAPEGGPPIETGGSVRVRGAQGLTLLVRPDREENLPGNLKREKSKE